MNVYTCKALEAEVQQNHWLLASCKQNTKAGREVGKEAAVFRSLELQFCFGPAVKGSNT